MNQGINGRRGQRQIRIRVLTTTQNKPTTNQQRNGTEILGSRFSVVATDASFTLLV
jgi:hypothetical protein